MWNPVKPGREDKPDPRSLRISKMRTKVQITAGRMNAVRHPLPVAPRYPPRSKTNLAEGLSKEEAVEASQTMVRRTLKL